MKVQNFNLQNSERKQAVSLFSPDQKTGTGILFLHGYKSSKEGYAEYAKALTQRLGAVSMTLDLAGHGESEGDFATLTPRDYLKNILQAYSYLNTRDGVDPARIGVVGASYGGYLATLLASMSRPKSLLLRAPAIYPDSAIDQAREDVDKEAIEEFRKSLAYSIPTNLALDSIRHFRGPMTVVESENDESIQTSVLDAYMRVSQDGLLRVIPGAHHSLVGPEREIFKEMLVDWAADL